MQRLGARFALALVMLAGLFAGAAMPAKKPRVPQVPASWEEPMQVVIVRSSEKGCEPYCPEWIMAEGRITGDTPGLFAQIYEKAKRRGGGTDLPVVLHSAGGNILAALQIGYFLRSRGVETAVGITKYSGCAPFGAACKAPSQDGAYRGRLASRQAICVSACPLILAGGSRRLASGETLLGVHHWGYEINHGKTKKPTFEDHKKDTPWDGVMGKMVSDYLTAMDISQGVAADMRKTPFAAMKLYGAKQRKALKLVNQNEAAQSLDGASVCAEASRAKSCVLAGDTPEYRHSLVMTGITANRLAMHVVIVRDARKECEPKCQQWIAAKGVIKPDTPKLFAKVLSRSGREKLPVLIDSPGGDLDAALEIGRMISKSGRDVVVSNIEYEGCTYGGPPCGKPGKNGLYRGVPKGRYDGCDDVCALILAAGRQRVLPGGADVRLRHPNSYVSRAAPAQADSLIGFYFTEMGLGPYLAERMRKIKTAYTRRMFSGQRSLELSLATTLDGSRWAGDAAICGSAAPPDHCVKLR